MTYFIELTLLQIPFKQTEIGLESIVTELRPQYYLLPFKSLDRLLCQSTLLPIEILIILISCIITFENEISFRAL